MTIGLYILDSHLASLFHHDALLRHDAIKLHSPADDEIFNCMTALQWKDQMLKRQQLTTLLRNCLQPDSLPPDELISLSSRLTAYFALQSISVQVSELQIRGQVEYESSRFLEICSALIDWYHIYYTSNSAFDQLGLIILWHTVFMNLFTNFDTLERALGRDGPNTSLEENISYAVTWANSISADRCILHAQIIQDLISHTLLKVDPGLHVPHCVFQAGIACYSAMNFRRRRYSQPQPSIARTLADFPEFDLRSDGTGACEEGPVLFQNAIGEQLMRTMGRPRIVWQVGGDIFRQCADSLDRMGHCGNSRRFAITLMALINPEIESWMLG